MRDILVIVAIILLFLVSCTNNQQITGSVVTTNNFIEDQGVVELFFCPQERCEENLNKALEEATISLHCAFYDIGLPSIQETLKRKAQSIEVLVVTDDDYLKKFNESFVRADKSGLMHNYLLLTLSL